eukprot:GHVS01081409.1.p1 GENE.GHVS01081409.1~~GHVS01081409.1.p1  ORF type:complete len:164 (+),score=33.63 GHVS01081409.1:156-647(+)
MSKIRAIWGHVVVLIGFCLIVQGGYTIMQLRKAVRRSGGMLDHLHVPPPPPMDQPLPSSAGGPSSFPSTTFGVDPLLEVTTGFSSVPVQVLMGVSVGALVALVGAVLQLGGFRPIRLYETKKAEWDSNYETPNFRSLHGRAKWAAHLTAKLLPPPPPPNLPLA